MLDKGVHSLFGDETAGRDRSEGHHSRNLSDASSVGSVVHHAAGPGPGPASAANGGFVAMNGAYGGEKKSVVDRGRPAAAESASENKPPPRTAAATSGGSVWRSVSGVLGSVASAIPLPKPKNQAKLGEEITMYYDEKLGRWVEPGREDEADAGPPPPPPTAFAAAPRSADASAAAPGGGGPVPGGAQTPPGAGPGANAFSMRAPKGSVRSRYVDTFGGGGGGGRGGAGGLGGGAGGGSPLLPRG